MKLRSLAALFLVLLTASVTPGLVSHASDLPADPKTLALDRSRPKPVDLSHGEFNVFQRNAVTILPKHCQHLMKVYERSPGLKTVFAAIDPSTKGRCGLSVNQQTSEAAVAEAWKKCDSARKRAAITAPCQQVIVENKVVLTLAAFGITGKENSLRAAIRMGSLQAARYSVARGAAVDTRSAEGLTALMLAAAKGSWPDYVYFLQQGADPGLRTNDGDNLAIMAVTGGNANIVRDVIEKQVDVNQPGANGITAAHAALLRYDFYLLTVLEDHAADFSIEANAGDTVADLFKVEGEISDALKRYRTLEFAARSDDKLGVDFYAAKISPEERKQRINRLISSFGLKNISPAMLKHLLKHGGDPNFSVYFGKTPLMMAAFTDNELLVAILLKAGADRNKKTFNGKRAIDFARSTAVRKLLQ